MGLQNSSGMGTHFCVGKVEKLDLKCMALIPAPELNKY